MSSDLPPEDSGRRAMELHAERVARGLDRLALAAPIDVASTVELRRCCAEVHGLVPLGPIGGPAAGSGGGLAPAVLDFARAFASDVAGVDDELRAAFLAAAADDAFATVQAIWISDQVPRVRALLDALFGPSEWDEPSTDRLEVGDAWPAIDDVIRTVHQLDALDPLTTEVVRLRGARQHDCRLCRSLRSRPALIAGGDDVLWDAVDDPSTLESPVHRAALGLLDAMIWTPARVPASVLADARRTLSPAQAVEVVLDVMRNGANKIAVALAADAPHVEDGIEVYEIDPDGTARYGLEMPGA